MSSPASRRGAQGQWLCPTADGEPWASTRPPARRKRSRIATHDAYLLPSLVMAFVVGWCRTSSAPGDRVAAPAPSWAPPWPGVHVRTAGEARMRPRHRQVRSHRIRTYGGSIIHSRSVTSKVRDARARPGLPSSSLLYCGVVTEELCAAKAPPTGLQRGGRACPLHPLEQGGGGDQAHEPHYYGHHERSQHGPFPSSPRADRVACPCRRRSGL